MQSKASYSHVQIPRIRVLGFEVGSASHPSAALPGLRLSILLTLQGKKNFLASYGVCCSSWVSTAIGGRGNMRSFVAPMGHPDNEKIKSANLMVSRISKTC